MSKLDEWDRKMSELGEPSITEGLLNRMIPEDCKVLPSTETKRGNNIVWALQKLPS